MSITLNGTVGPSKMVPIMGARRTSQVHVLGATSHGATRGFGQPGLLHRPDGCSRRAGAWRLALPGGQERLAVVDAAVFKNSELTVLNRMAIALPFAVTIE